jgi:soluble lytic murein transglycosylase-like protein/uncharacterized protein YukE
MSELSYRSEVEFLDGCNPALVERNADEFRRLRELLVEVESPAKRAANRDDWKSAGSQNYKTRLKQARELLVHLADGYDQANRALRHYATALESAKGHCSTGKRSEQELADLIATKGTAITRDAQEAEPMRRWEDMRGTSGVMDWLAESTMDIDDIKDRANRLHDQAGTSFNRAKRVEKEARDTCVAALKKAFESLPQFKTGSTERVDIHDAIPALAREAREARGNPLTHLPGSGPKEDLGPPTGDAIVSRELKDIRMKVANLPGDAADTYWTRPTSDEDRREWISTNKEAIRAAAKHSGLPTDMVAGIAWQEVGGQRGVYDDAVDTLREQADSPLSPIAPESLPWRFGGSPDETSFGLLATQVRRGAEVLGYDPDNLTDAQRATVEESLQDPNQNIFVASGYLAQLKAESEFADVPPEEMTRAQRQELAARYNGGPFWEGEDAQRYGRGFDNNLDHARSALR